MGQPEGKNHLKDPGIDVRIRWIFRKWVGEHGLD
jgi:hypothetical protein